MPSAGTRRAFLVVLVVLMIAVAGTTRQKRRLLMPSHHLLGFRLMASSAEHAAPTGSDSIVARHHRQDIIEDDEVQVTSRFHNATSNRSATKSKPHTNRPVLILHVGPPKTGSTTLQCTLESLRRELDQDGLAYIGRPECASMGFNVDLQHKREFQRLESVLVTGYDCQRQMNEWENQFQDLGQVSKLPTCWEDLLQHLEGYRQAGKNVMFSDEAMANRLTRSVQYRPSIPYPWRTLRTSLEQRGWDVRILLVHRPLYDYLPSVYVEQYKYGPNKIRLQRWFGGGDSSRGGDDNGSSSTGSSCPQQGGRKVPRPFDTDTNEITIARLIEEGQALYPTPAQVFALCQEHGFKTMLVDMMENFVSPNGQLDFVQHIVCNVLPSTSHTCKALLDGADDVKLEDEQTEGKAPHLNPSLPLQYDFIAVEACQVGLLNGTKVGRDAARRGIQRHQEQILGLSANDFPLICPDNETMAKILQQSLDQERQLRVDRFSQDELARHEEKYWDGPVKKNKYCTVDSKQVIEDEEWEKFFSSIGTE